jgi:hypothetical protein
LSRQQTAIAAAVDLRCYGLTSPRHDGILSVHFIDLDNYYREWDLDQLPWDAASPIDPADEHPDTLDEKLINAISSRALIEPIDHQPKARPAATTFLYLYMKLTVGEGRYAHLFRNSDGTG